MFRGLRNHPAASRPAPPSGGRELLCVTQGVGVHPAASGSFEIRNCQIRLLKYMGSSTFVVTVNHYAIGNPWRSKYSVMTAFCCTESVPANTTGLQIVVTTFRLPPAPGTAGAAAPPVPSATARSARRHFPARNGISLPARKPPEPEPDRSEACVSGFRIRVLRCRVVSQGDVQASRHAHDVPAP
jgi:hypothetical protein